MALNFVMLGPPGAGKGTQAERLARELAIPKISTGDILREAAFEGTELGRLAKSVMDARRLVSDEVMIGIVRDRLARPDTAKGFVLDGFPRTLAQASALDALMAARGGLLVVDIEVPDEELIRRMQARRICEACGHNATALGGTPAEVCEVCGGRLVRRSDDDEQVWRERLRTYAVQTKPLIDYYRERSALRPIDGNQPPDRVAAEVRSAVQNFSLGPADPVSERPVADSQS